MAEYRNVTNHAITLASGRPLAPGDKASVDLNDNPYDKALVDEGHLAKVETKKETSK
jgi:hypothetical protein